MSYRIDITGKNSYILIELFGDIAIQKIISLDSFLYADIDFIHHPFAIWDFTECTIDIHMEQIVEFITLIRKSRNSKSAGKTAFVTRHSLQEIEAITVDPLELFDLENEIPCKIKGFPTRVAAVMWISE